MLHRDVLKIEFRLDGLTSGFSAGFVGVTAGVLPPP